MPDVSLQILTQTGLTLLALILYSGLVALCGRAIRGYGEQHDIAEKRIIYTRKYVSAGLFVLLLFAIILIWGIDFRGLLIVASSVFAIVGVSLFASWSVLSSITSSVIIFFQFPYRIGDDIHLIDGENSITGTITDMTLFYVQIETTDGEEIAYPNNLAILKPIARRPKAPPGPDRDHHERED